jgi:hypothetical protein
MLAGGLGTGTATFPSLITTQIIDSVGCIMNLLQCMNRNRKNCGKLQKTSDRLETFFCTRYLFK